MGSPRRPRSALAAPAALVPPIYARLLRILLQHAAVDGDRVLAAAGLDGTALATEDRRLDRATVQRLAEGAISATRRPWLGLDLGASAPVSAHGPLGYAAVTSRDLGQALEIVARYGTIRNDAIAWGRTLAPDGLHMVAVERVALGSARDFVIDTTLAAILRIVEAAVGEVPAGITVDLPFAAPPWRAQYRRFGAEIRFGRPAFALHVPAPELGRPCLAADARAHASACRECEAALAEVEGTGLAQRVAGLLAAVEGAGEGGAWPRLAEVAARCGISARTLMRRLKAEGTSWQRLLDAARQERALWLLEHTGVAVEEIAARLGYADTSNFSRTMRRWFGATPRELRARRGRGDPRREEAA